MGIRSNLTRFPLPLNSREFQAFRYGPKVLANSIPKGGTHLLSRVLSLFPLLVPRWHYGIVSAELKSPKNLPMIHKGQYITTHLYWNKKLVNALNISEISTLFIIRDLRDVVVSRAYYLTHMLRDHPLSSYLNSISADEQLMTAIMGIDKYGIMQSIGSWARGYTPWLDEITCCTIRFEDLVGSAGGGSEEKQVEAVRMIACHLGFKLPSNQISDVASQAFCVQSKTFRKGQIGQWKNYFKAKHKAVFKEVTGDALIKLGYVTGDDW